MSHLRANLWLLMLTVLVTSVFYPGILWVVGQTVFHAKAEGDLLRDVTGTIIGAREIAEPFSDVKYFHPRPSAVAYNAAATGGSNLAASNPALRNRVLSQLGTVLKYRQGGQVGPDIETWVREQLKANRSVLLQWQQETPNLAPRWGADSAVAVFLAIWAAQHADEVAQTRIPEAPPATPADLASVYFRSYAMGRADVWPETNGLDLQTAFFEVWWKHHPEVQFEAVPSDLLLTSGSGVDPDITREAALYQLDRVVAAWTETRHRDPAVVRQTIAGLIESQSRAPLHGLVGGKLVNVLELNLAVRKALEQGG